MASEPIRERILQHCEASLWLINGSADYWHALADVQRAEAASSTLDKLPAAFLTEGEETDSFGPNPVLTRILPITVEAWLGGAEPNDPNLPTLANRLLADLERALTTDPTRGGLAIHTLMIGSSIKTDPKPGILAAVRVDFEIQYQTLIGDPATPG